MIQPASKSYPTNI